MVENEAIKYIRSRICNEKGIQRFCRDNCMHGEEQCAFQVAIKALEEIQQYRDSKEQGLLLRLPCKIGSTVWFVGNDFVNDYEVIRYVVDKTGAHYVQVASVIDGREYWSSFSIDDIGKTVFLTKEEADQALKQMRGVGMTENEQKAHELSDVLAGMVISLVDVVSEEEHEKIDSKCVKIVNCLWELARYKDIGTVKGYERAINSSIENYNLYREYKAKVQAFEAIGTIEEFKALKEKSVAKKPIIHGLGQRYCPVCKCGGADHFYCTRCGQKLG